MRESGILLGMDTCGSSGSIALGRADASGLKLLGQRELAGGEVAARIVPAIAELLGESGSSAAELAGIVVVAGPGSFTGIRVGLSAAKALAEACGAPVIAVSRLALLANVSKMACVALDAHRGQVYLGIYEPGAAAEEMLVTAGEFSALGRLPGPVAFCEEGVAHLVDTVAEAELWRVLTPKAFDALSFGLGRWRAGEFEDVATLDGYYLRGADAKTQAALAAGRG